MEQEIINYYSALKNLNVPRETYLDFEDYISMILKFLDPLSYMLNRLSFDM